jgi:SH3-like domain-containing protein
MRLWCAAILASALALASSGAAAKFHALAIGAYPRGSRVPISNAEFNAYLASEIPIMIGPGVRHTHVETASGGIVRGTADIDFLKVRQAHGEQPGWLMAQLLSGERPVAITVRVTSGNGKARVDVLKVAISGVVAEGRTLDFLISNFVVPTFPDVKVGTDFALDYHLDRLEILPGQVIVVVRP